MKTLVPGLDQLETTSQGREQSGSAAAVMGRLTSGAAIRGAEPVWAPRAAFRDNVILSRFETFHNGALAAFLKYQMRGDELRLLQTVVQRQFRSSESDVETLLIRNSLLQAHRRRLTVIPVCSAVTVFLMQYPSYLQLIPAAQRGAVPLTPAEARQYGNRGI